MTKSGWQDPHPILQQWLSGTTCHNYWIGRRVLFENDDFIVLKHDSHVSYCGRFSGNKTCSSYARLYRKADLVVDARGKNRNLSTGWGAIKEWRGRISRKRVQADCLEMGIVFREDIGEQG